MEMGTATSPQEKDKEAEQQGEMPKVSSGRGSGDGDNGGHCEDYQQTAELHRQLGEKCRLGFQGSRWGEREGIRVEKWHS